MAAFDDPGRFEHNVMAVKMLQASGDPLSFLKKARSHKASLSPLSLLSTNMVVQRGQIRKIKMRATWNFTSTQIFLPKGGVRRI